MSGIECVGLILGVMPLVIECAKAYPKATKVVRNTTRPNLSDEALETYLSELALLLREFKLQMQRIFDYLPDLGTARKIELLNDFNLEDWRPGGDVAKAFMAMFPDPDDFSWFEDIVTQVIRQMGQLIRDTQVFTQKSSTVRSLFHLRCLMRRLTLEDQEHKHHVRKAKGSEIGSGQVQIVWMASTISIQRKGCGQSKESGNGRQVG